MLGIVRMGQDYARFEQILRTTNATVLHSFNDEFFPDRVMGIHIFLLLRRKRGEINLLVLLILFEKIVDSWPCRLLGKDRTNVEGEQHQARKTMRLFIGALSPAAMSQSSLFFTKQARAQEPRPWLLLNQLHSSTNCTIDHCQGILSEIAI
jgi:hypothetical protein